MKKNVALTLLGLTLLSSCVSKQQFTDLQAEHKKTKDLLNTATVKLNACLADASAANARVEGLKERLADLKRNNEQLIKNSDGLTELSTKGAENLERSLESLKERDLKINRLQEAVSRKDSVTLALVKSFKKTIGIDDPDIQVNVEKGVVFIEIADKLLFKSGSYNVTSKAKDVLRKVAIVINEKPDFEAMVEGHTDTVPYQKGVLLDNWDLSVKRSTSIIRVLQELGVNSSQLIAAGRSSYVPKVDNDTAANRAVNRRTRVIVLPKIDQFYDMIEQEMKKLSAGE